jgi:Domain of unknown function (DUF3472)/Domain of unknown function (DUF5077)
MKGKIICCLLVVVATALMANAQKPEMEMQVPLGGNSWMHSTIKNNTEAVTDTGWINWQHAETVFSTYINLAKTGRLNLTAILDVPQGKSTIKCTINGITKLFNAEGAAKKYAIGVWEIQQTGYVKIDMQGVSKTGKLFATINELTVSGAAVNDQTAFVKNNDDNYFYWGRRGPSVHLNYNLPDSTDNIEWFYNEVTVPRGNDVIGSFFMANGFGEGYFGMQVNSKWERRVLFSVWSPYTTDDPSAIPQDKKIILLKKGTGVHTGEFGNEGSGGQSFFKYNWKAGATYKFLLRAKPIENNYTNYTAYFYASEEKRWLLIASFNRPATKTYLTKLHSFLENFEPATGNITRKGWYHHQWVRTTNGVWKPISKATFTADATAKKRYRLDYGCGAKDGKFFLHNAGFFNDSTALKTIFSITPAAKTPDVNLIRLESF